MITYYVERPGLLRPRYYLEAASGLSLLRVELPRRWNPRRVGRMQRRMGAAVTLNLPKTTPEGIVTRLISTRELWQRAAAAAALASLARSGIPPSQATVGILAARLSGPVWDAMEALSDQVQALTLLVPRVEQVTLRLQLRNGIPVRQGLADLTLCFSRVSPGPGRLLLGEERPAPPGLGLTVAGITPPEGCPAEGFYAALLSAGKLPTPPTVVWTPTAPVLPPGAPPPL